MQICYLVIFYEVMMNLAFRFLICCFIQISCLQASLHVDHLDQEMQSMMQPYFLPLNHPLKNSLDIIFSNGRVTENQETFANAGFITLFTQPTSLITVARHPSLPGVLLKLYLDSETREKDGIPGWKWLVNRCKGAENVRKLIKRKKLKYFCVPDKWIYPLPDTHSLAEHPVILIVTDMDLTSESDTKYAWKHLATTKHLDELFCILSHGFSSCYLATNIPYTKSGKFACIDTEHPKRKLSYNHVKAYLSPPMRAYWNELIK